MKKLVEEVTQRTGLHRRTVRCALGLEKHPSGGQLREATIRNVQRALAEIREETPKEARHAHA